MIKLIFLLLPIAIFAQSFMLSNIPLPKTYIQNLDPYECDEECMQEYLDNGMIFSFLAHSYKKLESAEQNEACVMFISVFNLGSFHSGKELRIALLLPYRKIGKYASSTTNATFAYLMTKGHPFMLQSYKIESEELEELESTLEQMKADGFEYIIAPLTKKGADNIIQINPTLNVYFPTIHKHDVNTSSPYLSFGAIDYIEQSNLLLKEALTPLVIFSDESSTGKKLALHQKKEFINPTSPEIEKNDFNNSSFFDEALSIFPSDEPEEKREQELLQNEDQEIEEKNVVIFHVSRRTTNLESYLKENEDIIDGSFFINTPIIKTGMVMSQLTLYDTNTTNILSTQINYNPLLLSMTQYVDRKNMVVANSLTQHNNVLIETNAILGNDITYDWINYTTTVGVDYFYGLITDDERTYTTTMQDNQMIYDVELLQPSKSKFIKYIRPFREPKVPIVPTDELEKTE
jgi:hypothetical protein